MIALALAGLIVLKLAMQLWLTRLNRRQVRANADAVPAAFKEIMDEATYAKSVQYTLAKSRLSEFEDIYDTIILLLVLFSGVLPWSFQWGQGHFGNSAWALAGVAA